MSNHKSIWILRSPQWTAEERGLYTQATFLGVDVRDLTEAGDHPTVPERPLHFAATAQSLEIFLNGPNRRDWLFKELARAGSSLFVTGIQPAEEHRALLATLLPDVVQSIDRIPADASHYDIPENVDGGMRPFSGLKFGPVDRQNDATFSLEPGTPGVHELVTVGGRASYVKITRAGASYFLAGSARVLDLDAPARPGERPLERFLRFVPFLAYLRSVFGALCWHNPQPAACIVIDDPLLKERYGFLDFNHLESRMERTRFSTNIAFIPWNFRRSNRNVIEKFKRADRRLSISVHGCDHTEAEFGIADEQWLRSQARRAMIRMDAHERLTGIEHNRIMVFPQGKFSSGSLSALGDAGFIAAVNSTIYPVDAGHTITFRDLLQVAVLRFGGVPLFGRHYPNRPEVFALDLFLGRQVVVVEHHSFFKDGYDRIEAIATFINRIAANIRWTDLDDLCTSACLVREVASGTLEVQAFGPLLSLRNDRTTTTRFHIRNAWARGRVKSVRWHGRSVAFRADATGTVCELQLASNEKGALHFECEAIGNITQEADPATIDRLRVFVRRHLSEFRDNYLDRSAVLQQLAATGKKLLPRM